MKHRWLVRDYEARPENSASTITIPMIDKAAHQRVTDVDHQSMRPRNITWSA